MQYDDTLVFGTQIDDNGFRSGLAGLDSAVTVAAGNILSEIASAVTSALAEIPKQIVAIGSEFEASMSQVAATMGITSAAEEFEQLSQAAKDMGAATKFSASQAAEALNYLALAGYDADKSCAALPTVLNLASAGGIELAQASDMVTDSMSALNLSMDELGGFADKMAKASQKSNTSVSQLGQSILSVGANARILAGGTTELMTELGILADSGTKSAEAGTALARVIKNLSTPTSTAAAELDRLGVKCYDAEGDFRNMQDIFKDLQTAMSGFTAEQVQSSLSEIFDTAALSSAKVLLSQCGDRFDELSGYIDNASGAASDMAETMNDNLTGDITICQSAVEALANTAYEKFSGTMRTAVQSVTEEISTLNESMTNGELSESMDILSEAFGSAAESAATLLADDVIPGVVNGLSMIIEHGNTIIGLIVGLEASFIVLKNIEVFEGINKTVVDTIKNFELLQMETTAETFQQTALNSEMTLGEIAIGLFSGKLTVATAKEAAHLAVTNALTAAQGALNTAIKANPIGLIVTAVSVLVPIITTVIGLVKDAKRETENLTEATNEYADAMDNAREKGQEEIDKTTAEVGVIKEKAERYEELREKYDNLTSGEMTEFLSLCDELTKVLPEGTSLIDAQTGAYLSLADSIDKVCSKMEKQAVLNAKYQEYEEAAGQNYDIEKQMKQAEAWADEQGYAAGSVFYGYRQSQLNAYCEAEFGLSYDDLNATKEQNEQIIDEYHQLYDDTYNDINETVASGGTQKTEATIAAMQSDANEIAAKSKENAEMLAKQQEAATNKLKDGWANAEHLYNIGVITSDKELYAEKARLWEEYGDDSLEAHWQYEEDLISLDKQITDKQAENSKKATEEAKKKRKEEMEQAWTDISNAEELGDLTLEEAAKKRAEFMAQYVPDPTAYHDWYVKCQKDTEDLAKLQKDEAKKQWDHIDDLESVGLLTEEQAYKQRLEWIEKYCEEGSDEWYDYYKEIYAYEKKMAEKQLSDKKKLLKEELNAVKNNVSDIVSKYKESYSEIKSNMDNYKKKLLDVAGSAIEIKETENPNGTKTKTYKVKDIQKQINTMKKYHEAMLKLRDKGANKSLLSELLSIDDAEDGLRMANYVLKSSNFDEINRLYTERDKLAKDMAEEFYAPEVEKLNSDTADKIKAEYDKLPEEFRDIGKTAAEELIKGLAEGVESMEKVFDRNFDSLENSADKLMDGMTVSVNLPSVDNAAKATNATNTKDGQAATHTSALSGSAAVAPTVTADYNANQSALSAELNALGSMLTGLPAKIAESIKEMRIATKIYNTIELDGKVAAESVNNYNKSLAEMGGT